MTWNVWGRHGPWQLRLEAIAATLSEVAPDVCGLQEVWSDNGRNLAAELAERLGLYWRWAQSATSKREEGVSFGNAVLSRWPPTADATIFLPTHDHAEGRIALHALVDAPAGGLPFFTTHLTHQHGGTPVRLAQVTRLAEFVADHAKDGIYPPVVTGDFNAEPASDELRLLGGVLTAPAVPGQVLIDAWRYASRDDCGFTWDRANSYQADSEIPDSRIDYILTGLPRKGRGRVRSTRLAGNIPVDGVWPSDHFAVVSDLEALGQSRPIVTFRQATPDLYWCERRR